MQCNYGKHIEQPVESTTILWVWYGFKVQVNKNALAKRRETNKGELRFGNSMSRSIKMDKAGGAL